MVVCVGKSQGKSQGSVLYLAKMKFCCIYMCLYDIIDRSKCLFMCISTLIPSEQMFIARRTLGIFT